jgi:hypothetical protein
VLSSPFWLVRVGDEVVTLGWRNPLWFGRCLITSSWNIVKRHVLILRGTCGVILELACNL